MKKHFKLLLFITLLFIPTVRGVAAEQDLTSVIIVTGSYPPAINEADEDKGYVSRLVADAFALEGIKTKFTFVPWARGLRMIRLGHEACIMYYAKTPDRIKSFIFSEPLFEEEWLFFHLKSTPVKWQELTDLSRYIIGATLSYTYSEEFHKLADQQELSVHWVARDEQNWKMLMGGRIDIFPSVKTGWYQLRQLYSEAAIKQVTTHSKPLKTQLNYLLCSKDHPNAEYFRDKFNQGFTKLKKLRPISYYIPDTNSKTWPVEIN
ncbi:substrate-binding periplasmic protein [Colwellia psychrerythraea]|uniref:ABC-type transporter, periplasmic subunit family 3 n=1 Tax=Colwellia psychrerythraea TaxID=28229 RepID=A0A099KFW6_COLPS|nr:ABC transporter substrate-binding protein [Colwellia psychrerythraea]KGJ89165.1 ABC-type transporter, periplasmic subunit family 3 [Colwellia psychrerythraea]